MKAKRVDRRNWTLVRWAQLVDELLEAGRFRDWLEADSAFRRACRRHVERLEQRRKARYRLRLVIGCAKAKPEPKPGRPAGSSHPMGVTTSQRKGRAEFRPALAREAKQAGVTNYIVKPYNAVTLRNKPGHVSLPGLSDRCCAAPELTFHRAIMKLHARPR